MIIIYESGDMVSTHYQYYDEPKLKTLRTAIRCGMNCKQPGQKRFYIIIAMVKLVI